MNNRYSVVVVGGGPVGVALAIELGRRGISCALVETRPALHQVPKGQNLTQRTLEHFARWGVADQLRAARLMPKGHPIGEITAYDNLMSEWWQAPAGRELVRPFYGQDNERLPQYRMEMVLREKLAGVPNVTRLFGWSAVGLSQTDAGAQVSIRNEESGAEQALQAAYVVGCDGARSIVREAAGISRSGHDFERLMVLLVFRSKALNELLKRFPLRSTYRVLHPDFEGYWQFFGRIDGEESFFFHAPVSRDIDRAGFDFRGPLYRAVGAEFEVSFDYTGFWELRNAVAQNYRAGRVFIAGDAAHTHPPYGGFGLNNGLEDAINLGWKLAARLQGWGGETLLDSYSLERQPVFREVADDFIAERIRIEGAFLARHHPSRDRDDFVKAWAEREGDLGLRVNRYEPHYDGSPVVLGAAGGTSGAHGEHRFEARAGHHLAPQPLSTGGTTFERLDDAFTLFDFDGPDGDSARLTEAAARRGLPISVVRDSYADERQRYGRRLILVRPDQFVAWTADAVPENVDALIDRIAG